MSRTVLILSGQYVSQSMQTELGHLPPAFLSLAGVSLFRHQAGMIAQAGGADTHLLTLPESYAPTDWQTEEIRELGYQVVATPDNLGLGEAILYALTASGNTQGGLRLLYGDTLIDGLDLNEEDLIVTGAAPAAGYWARLASQDGRAGLETRFLEAGEGPVIAGYMSFSSIGELLRAIVLERYMFIPAITRYHARNTLSTGERGTWFDFGRPRSFFDSRRNFTTQRHFNDLRITRDVVSKSSEQTHKMRAEANWFDALPAPLRFYTPAFLGRLGHGQGSGNERDGYTLEYLQMLPVNECYTELNLPMESWKAIVAGCKGFLDLCRSYSGDPIADFGLLYRDKTAARLREFSRQTGLDPDRNWRLNGSDVGSFNSAARKALALIPPAGPPSIMHGDLCFSNIMFDPRTGRIRVIDPRGGIDLARPSIYGDPRYDLAKLCHSYDGHYDLILAGRARLVEIAPYEVDFSIDVGPEQQAVSALFRRSLQQIPKAEAIAIQAIAVLLFLSMPPLHADRPERQRQLAVNALRLAARLPATEEAMRA